MLLLDYPVLKDISEYTGIDKIFEYIKCIGLEQKFLGSFPAGYVENILSKNNRHWKESMDNICETVFTYVTGHILAGKSLSRFELMHEDYVCLQELFTQKSVENIKERLKTAIEILIRDYYESDRELFCYLWGAIDDIVTRMKNAADNNVMVSIFEPADGGAT